MANNTSRDAYGRSVNDLTESVHSLANGFKELSGTIVSALEKITPGQSQAAGGNSDPAFGLLKHFPALDPANFKDLKYWHRAPWSDIRNGKADVDPDHPTLTLFFEDATGNLVPKTECQAVRDHAKKYFGQLWEAGRAPDTWSDASPNLQIGFVRHMEGEFEFLRYCDRHWKSEQVFMNYYPNWYDNKKNPKIKKSRKRARPNDEDKQDNNNDNNDNNGSSKRPRMEEVEAIPPPVQPVSTTVTTTRKRVRSLWYLTFMLVKSLQNPLYEHLTVCMPVIA